MNNQTIVLIKRFSEQRPSQNACLLIAIQKQGTRQAFMLPGLEWRSDASGGRSKEKKVRVWVVSFFFLMTYKPKESPSYFTSGSPVSMLVWISILPMRTSFKTSHRAVSIVSPARKIDAPQMASVAIFFPSYGTPWGVSTTTSCKFCRPSESRLLRNVRNSLMLTNTIRVSLASFYSAYRIRHKYIFFSKSE